MRAKATPAGHRESSEETAFAWACRYKAGNTRRFKFQKKKAGLWTMGIEKQVRVKKGGEMEMFKGGPFKFGSFQAKDKIFKGNRYKEIFRDKKGDVLEPKHDCFIHRDRYNRYYLITPYKEKVKKTPKKGIVSIDPGLRKFLSTFSPDGEFGFLGENCRERLWGLLEKIDHYDRELNKEGLNPKHKRTLRRRKTAVYRKMSDLKKELHDKTIAYLTDRYKTILLGKLNVSHLTGRKRRSLRTKETRSLLTLAHCEFRTKLAHKCREKSVILGVVNESWTSKTCTGCGLINRHLGGSEVFNCRKCPTKIDRDLNGARNILIKHIGQVNCP